MTNELTVPNNVQDLTADGITQEDANKIRLHFSDVPNIVSSLDDVYDKIIKLSENDVTEELAEQAKDLSKKYGKIRTKFIDAGHKEAKHYALQYGRYCDTLKKDMLELVKPKEQKLDSIANFFKEQQRLAKEALKGERIEVLNVIDPDGDYKYSGVEDMDDNVFDHFVAGVEAKVAKARADAKLLEEARIIKEKADKEAAVKAAEEAKALREENERLRRENEEAKASIPVKPADIKSMKETNDKHIVTLMLKHYEETKKAFTFDLVKTDKGKEILDKTMVVNDKLIKYLTEQIQSMEE